ncbi:type IX secretion system membrane protein PorP/SprF [Flavobacterium cucumis]|uniref:Type IX secretion system membrane protein, PorP/SprF family n=1 Tax=Flavobacterium cucumis TaxID=416016 RepID=A0A1M7ZWG3_9FLAO|nr:type IX secretion system membrane protein PorP/SprF [Flavobacterium cucumis]SHO73208.1 type IX secretion system membrane protein, PorP/SprF family [Flavobacterium cucumis]
MNYIPRFRAMVLLMFLGLPFVLIGQQDPLYTNYMYNPIVFNPAYAGTREVVSFFGHHRSQWVGLDGAPVTSSFSMQTPLGYSNLGLGVSFLNEEIGPSVDNTIGIDISYKFDLPMDSKLSFGIKASGHLLNIDYSKLLIDDPTDPQYQNNIDNRFSPNIGAGVYWYTDRFYLGFSIPNFLETSHYDDNSTSLVEERLHYYFMAGHVFDLNEHIQFKPALLSKFRAGFPMQLDLTSNFLLFEKLTLGIAYRLESSFSGLVGFQVSDQIFLGYSYDAETSKLANYNSGSHELFLRFEIFNSSNKIYSPRFF